MRTCIRVFQQVTLTGIVMLLAGNPVWAQPQTTETPRAAVPPGGGSPISPFLFGPPSYPYTATAPSSFTRAPSAVQISSGIYRGPSLGSIVSPLPTVGLSHAMHSQPNLGAFIGFAPPSVVGGDASALLPGMDYRPAPDNRAHISLYLPADAQVWFDGKATKQTGTVRQYDSPELTPGKKYHYEVRVRWMKDGKPVEEKRRIEIEARDWLRFDLTRPPAP